MKLPFIDSFLNSVTMYRLVMYGLLVLAIVAIVFGFFHKLPYSGISYIETLVVLGAVCYGVNFGISKVFKATTGDESWLITATILFFVLAPIGSLNDLYVTIGAGVIAMASKYVLAINKKHIFNPAAIAVFLLGLFGFGNGIWWVGSLVLLPLVLVFGLLVVRKIRRFHMFFSFLITALITLSIFNLKNQMSMMTSMSQAFVSWPLIFFGTIMLTEPLTSPARKNLQMVYGAIVGVLFGSQFQFGPLNSSPECALIIGNIFSYIVSPKQKLFTTLTSSREVGKNLYEFVFQKPGSFSYIPGQYLEWTLGGFRSDLRGNRRYFTIASSPTEADIKLGVKIVPDQSSTFKKKLLSLKPGDTIVADHLAGDFVMPRDQAKKLVFIAGGIGVTPFRSMIQSLIDAKEKRDIVLFYTASNPDEFAYQDIFSKAVAVGVRTIYVVTKPENAPKGWTGAIGRIDDKLIQKEVPDFKTRMFYLSGPNVMVEGYKKMLHELGVSGKQLITDYFPGF